LFKYPRFGGYPQIYPKIRGIFWDLGYNPESNLGFPKEILMGIPKYGKIWNFPYYYANFSEIPRFGQIWPNIDISAKYGHFDILACQIDNCVNSDNLDMLTHMFTKVHTLVINIDNVVKVANKLSTIVHLSN
jgi:hypothetical protein